MAKKQMTEKEVLDQMGDIEELPEEAKKKLRPFIKEVWDELNAEEKEAVVEEVDKKGFWDTFLGGDVLDDEEDGSAGKKDEDDGKDE